MLYNIVLVSAVQQSESAICIHITPLFRISFPFRSPQSSEFPVLYSRFSLVIYFIHSINSAYMSIPISQFIPTPPFLPWNPYIHSLCLSLYFCFANKFICIVLLDSTYKQYYTIFVFLFLTYFTLYDSL